MGVWQSPDKPELSAADPVQTAFDKLVRAATDTDWPSEAPARKELGSLDDSGSDAPLVRLPERRARPLKVGILAFQLVRC
jgi:hypothetical protein